MPTAIQVQNLSKAYQLGEIGTGTISRDLERYWAKLRGKEDPFLRIGETNDRSKKGESDIVWSLKDINFEIQQGDAVGIIGRNGAGKSTLLKILSRVTSPTTGSVKVKGRIASLLEVGTGFHPELSGRENIFLNGAILGMRKAEIKKHFDAIVDFAGVERYIDTPVKRYSSGMYVRLAFAVAAHLESEILVVDEVLAVGDAEFQKKCLGKMGDLSKGEGRTVLFVSHNMGSISQLCSKSALMDNGKLTNYGNTEDIINHYLDNFNNKTKSFTKSKQIIDNHFETIIICDEYSNTKENFKFDENIAIKIRLIVPNFSNSLELAMRLIDRNKKAIFTIHEQLNKYCTINEKIDLLITIPKQFLTPGNYSWVMCINHPGVKLYDLQDDILPFTIVETGSEFSRYEGADYGSVFAQYSIKKLLN
jgi:lipopolysaccharide transport system ATP-binding protein